jgi:hypothetical protein
MRGSGVRIPPAAPSIASRLRSHRLLTAGSLVRIRPGEPIFTGRSDLVPFRGHTGATRHWSRSWFRFIPNSRVCSRPFRLYPRRVDKRFISLFTSCAFSVSRSSSGSSNGSWSNPTAWPRVPQSSCHDRLRHRYYQTMLAMRLKFWMKRSRNSASPLAKPASSSSDFPGSVVISDTSRSALAVCQIARPSGIQT